MKSNRQEATVKRLRLQAAIAREERAKTEALFLSIGQGVIATDEHGKIIRINKVALDILGYSREDLMRTWFPKAIMAVREDNSSIDLANRPISKALLQGETINENLYYLRKDGSRVPVSVTISPILLKNKPVGAIQIFRDTSIEYEGDRMKTDFISVASHQLRTPLAAINTYSHMLNAGYAGDLNDDQNSFLKVIMSAAERMNELIMTLLNITRIEAGSITIDSETVRLDEITRELVAEFEAQAEAKNITLKLQIDKNIPIINSDSLLIKEIFSNLLSNAIKYTPDSGKVTIRLVVRRSHILFSATDTGYGIPIKAQSLIFTKFFRADNILKTEVSGTGLGLYLIKILADNLGSEVWFKSQENKGSTFYVALPINGSPAKTGNFRLEG